MGTTTAKLGVKHNKRVSEDVMPSLGDVCELWL